jgi:hypothetical protein
MNHRTAILLKKPFHKIEDGDKRRELERRARKKWLSMNWRKRTQKRKDIENYGVAGMTNG